MCKNQIEYYTISFVLLRDELLLNQFPWIGKRSSCQSSTFIPPPFLWNLACCIVTNLIHSYVALSQNFVKPITPKISYYKMVVGSVAEQNKGTVNSHFFSTKVYDCHGGWIWHCTNKGISSFSAPVKPSPGGPATSDCNRQLKRP